MLIAYLKLAKTVSQERHTNHKNTLAPKDETHSQRHQHQAQRPARNNRGQVLRPRASKIAAYNDSQRHQRGNFEVKVLRFVVRKKTDDPDGKDRNQQRCSLRAQLREAKKINQGGNNKSAAGAGEANQHADRDAEEKL